MKKIFNLMLANVCLWTSFPVVAETINVVIASKNEHKILAVSRVFQEEFPEATIELMTYEATSGIPEQPIFQKTALKGVRNRVNSLPQELLDKADYVVSIENYIEQDLVSQEWQDRGLVLLKKRENPMEILCLTQRVSLPNRFVELAKELSSEVSEEGYSCTVGHTIEEYYEGKHIDAHDWHHEAEFGGISRGELLREAICKAIH